MPEFPPSLRIVDKDLSLHEALRRVTATRVASAEESAAEAGPEIVVTAVRRLGAQLPEHAPFPDAVSPRLQRVLASKGVNALYTHQAEAVAHALAGRNVVVTTPTASGKTLCYNLPVLNALLQDGAARALYLFPTKALAQDQLAELHRLADALGRETGTEFGAFTYDGDTPQDARRAIRTRAHVVLSNPDMLHSGILPHHPRWAKLFENLRYVVIDELHAYRGVFGSHLANILRRLRRVCRHYGSDPVFICSSATIANPLELAERLTERRFELVDRSGAPRGEKVFVFVNPPVVSANLGIRRSCLAEARRIALEFLRRNLQIIVFAQSRLSTEILTTYLKDAFPPLPGSPEPIRGYRGGYLPLRRREIEKGLREGEVRAVVSTNALELGIDIGALDVAVLAGYPGTIAATWQRAGRAGRRHGRSAAVLVASSAPVDQFVVRNPSYFFDASPEHALINPDNLQILLDHIKCAAFELPFTDDELFSGEDVQQILTVLAEERFVHFAEGQWNWTHESYPADAVSLRSISSDNFVVIDITREGERLRSGRGPEGERGEATPPRARGWAPARAEKVIGETDFSSALSTLHEKAIYIVEGQLYQVERLDFDNRKAFVREVDCDYYTDAITYTRVTILDVFGTAGLKPWATEAVAQGFSLASHGEVHVVSRVVGFKKIKFYTNENVGSGELDLPEQQMHTTAYWLTIPSAAIAALPYATDERRDGVIGLASAMRHVAQLLLMCDRHDIGISIDEGAADQAGGIGAWAPDASSPATSNLARRAAVSLAEPTLGTDGGGPKIFIYDNYPGGIGFSEPLYRLHTVLLDSTRRLIAGCPCTAGCPSCVGPIGESGPRVKEVAARILEQLQGDGLIATA